MTDQRAKAGSPARFSLEVTPGASDEFDMWRASVSPMFEIAPLSPEERAAFGMETTGYFLPGLAVTRTASSACSFVRSRAVIAKSGIDNILVQVYVDGQYELEIERLRIQIRPGDIVVFDLTRPSVIHAGPYVNIALTLQRDMIAPMIVDMEKLHGLILRDGQPRNVLLRSHMQMLHAEAMNIGVTEQPAIVRGTAALVAACLGPSLASRDAVVSGDATTTLQLIRRAIDNRLDDTTMDPGSLAKQFGLSRASLYRLFKPLGGVGAYIRHRRLMHAYQLLTNPSQVDEPIGAIARHVDLPRARRSAAPSAGSTR